jgi:AAA15 family ATPase/GTPase
MNSSLIEFTIRNYRSVRDSITVNMIASGKLKDMPENLFSVKAIDARLLRTAVFYGANASGKTNLFKAVHFAKRFILESVVLSTGGVVIPRSGFKL